MSPVLLQLCASYGCHHNMRVVCRCLRYLSFQDLSLEWTHMCAAPILTTVSTAFSPGMSVPSTPSSGVPPTTMRCDNNCARQTLTQGVEIWSISLSLITLITHARVQVPITTGTRLPKVDLSRTTRNTTSSSYPATSLT